MLSKGVESGSTEAGRAVEKSGEKLGWQIDDSRSLYQVKGWGAPYFNINEKGNAEVRPDPRRELRVDLYELAQELQEKGNELPILIRFSDVLDDRIRQLNECFNRAITEYEYQGEYRGVYPVKVNQQRHLVEELVEFGKPWQYGLEAGSKPELLIALALMREPGSLIICNGYKDASYIETALLAQRLGYSVIIVLERAEELPIVLEASERLGLRPNLGVRSKLTARGVGRWADSTGDRAKFGLTAAEIVGVIDKLAEVGKLDSLQLLHFHMGSQISSILALKNALREAAHFYTEMVKLGCPMKYIDVGGGLAVDYDGSQTDFHASKNYSMQEYAYDVVATIQESCKQAEISVPTIVTESGRAVAAYQSVLVFQVLGVSEVRYGEPQPPQQGAHPLLHSLYETWKGIQPKNLQEAWHDASQARHEARSLFQFGYLGLRDRAQAERLFWNCCEKIQKHLKRNDVIPEELQDLDRMFASVYYCNFSVFQSIPDSWAIDQLFPIMPIHRHDEQPTVHATLADLTCDSDGVVDRFIDFKDVKRVLELHPYKEGEPYLMAIFLNGAYQEILGDLHNLFGTTNAVHVKLDDESYHISHVVRGDSVNEVLRYTQYDPKNMVERVRHLAEKSLRRGDMTIPQMRLLMRHYEESLGGYTYLSADSTTS